jgi:hypothetical protein
MAIGVLLSGIVLQFFKSISLACCKMFLIALKSIGNTTAVAIASMFDFSSTDPGTGDFEEQALEPVNFLSKGIIYFLSSATGIGLGL